LSAVDIAICQEWNLEAGKLTQYSQRHGYHLKLFYTNQTFYQDSWIAYIMVEGLRDLFPFDLRKL
jgi:hypothetical protein